MATNTTAEKPKIMRTVFSNLLAELKTVYTQPWFLPQESFAVSVDSWYRVLSGYTYDELKAAAGVYMGEHDTPPMPSSIKDLCDQARREGRGEGGSDLSGFVLWEVVDRETGQKACHDILANSKYTAADILEDVYKMVGTGNYSARRKDL